MTTLYAQSTGNWDAINWNTAANGSGSNQTPGASDTVVSNGKTVTVNGNYTVTRATNTSGGTFTLTDGVTFTATDFYSAVTSGTLITFNLSSPATASLVGIVDNRVANNGQYVVTHSGTGTLNITGAVYGGTNASPAVYFTGTGTLNITGNVTGGSASVTGYGINSSGTGSTMTVTGACFGSSTPAVYMSGASQTNRILGTLTASSSAVAVSNQSTTAVVKLSGPIIGNATGGKLGIDGYSWRWDSTVSSVYYQIPTNDLSIMKTLYTADSVGGNPSAANVRSGTTFGPSGELTGTLAVPPAGSVTLGVPVDNTTGTAVNTQEAISQVVGAIWAQG